MLSTYVYVLCIIVFVKCILWTELYQDICRIYFFAVVRVGVEIYICFCVHKQPQLHQASSMFQSQAAAAARCDVIRENGMAFSSSFFLLLSTHGNPFVSLLGLLLRPASLSFFFFLLSFFPTIFRQLKQVAPSLHLASILSFRNCKKQIRKKPAAASLLPPEEGKDLRCKIKLISFFLSYFPFTSHT